MTTAAVTAVLEARSIALVGASNPLICGPSGAVAADVLVVPGPGVRAPAHAMLSR